MLYKNKIAVISGSTSGLGTAVALKLAKEGAQGLLITGRNAERGEKVVAELQAIGCQAVFVQADLADPDAGKKIFSVIDAQFDGRLHGLVNSAAYTARGSLEHTTVEEWDKHFAVNVRAPFLLMQEAIRRMQKHHISGSIVNIASVSAHVGQEILTPYSASKGALVTLSKNVAHSQSKHRIRCNVLLPGWMDTPAEHEIQRTYHEAPDDWLERAEATKPFGQLIKADELAELVAFLLSDKSGIMTGAAIDYDQIVLGTYD
ncbi:MAG: SDR family oxidoreductase [Saprospiraceae bacterium]|nr:SDR family oxidoreductase [Saprospiraceae bacterium]